MAQYTAQEYHDMLLAFGECRGQHYTAARRYAELYPSRARHPEGKIILGASQRLRDIGSMLPNKHECGKNRDARNLRNVETIIGAAEQEPETSIRTLAREHDLSYYHRTEDSC